MAMMTLGMFVFEISSLAYDELNQSIEWRHPTNSRIGKRPASQFAGIGAETITLPGVLYPGVTGGQKVLDQIETMGNDGKSYALIEGTGRVYGFYVINSLNIVKKEFLKSGIAQKITFTLKLTRTDDNDRAAVAALNSATVNQLQA